METWSLVALRDLEERFEMVGDGAEPIDRDT